MALRNVIVNLIENSIDALDTDGFIELSTGTVGDHAFVQVRDNGAGMSEETIAKATTAFFSTKKSHGTGLGLSIVDKIVKKHYGTVELASTPGVGTTVHAPLPCTRLPRSVRRRRFPPPFPLQASPAMDMARSSSPRTRMRCAA